MQANFIPKRVSALIAASLLFALTGCAGSVTQWMVNLRTSQADTALDNKNLVEAQKEYALALALDPKNSHARAGLAQALYLEAKASFERSKLDDAQAQILRARRYAPD